ncbi:MAG: arginine--tRNA ligase [Nitrospirota bacterium]|nr:arginine--tRNA ligase [Nitrospirota bacterium]
MDIRQYINSAIQKLGAEVPFVELEVPRVALHGDLSTPVAMVLAKRLKKAPRVIAEELASILSAEAPFERVEVAGPGFINFTFKRQFLYAELQALLNNPSRYLRKDLGGGQRVQVEFVSANPTGPLHLGHGRGAAVGAALANLLERAGYEVEREFYINDAGRQVRLLGESIFARYKEILGVTYPFPEEGYRGDYIKDLAADLLREVGERFKDSDFDDADGFFIRFGVDRMLREMEADLRGFGVVFDRWQSEKALYDEGLVKKCLEELREKGKLYEEGGALWFRATEFGDDKDRVVIKSDGSHTYFASDIAYHWYKIQRGFDELINIWGADHHGYVPRIKAVIRALGYPEDRLGVLLVQIVTLLRGGRPVQMSKRSGEFVTLREVTEEVGADTTKFIFLTRSHDSHLEFDIEVAKKESSENPVYYVQYAYARINSIFGKAGEEGIETGIAADLDYLKEETETGLIKKILFYPLMFEGAVRTREPHRVTFYLQELAGLFHPYYNTHRVLGVEPAALTLARLSLCDAVKTVLKEGLSTLGVAVPERM